MNSMLAPEKDSKIKRKDMKIHIPISNRSTLRMTMTTLAFAGVALALSSYRANAGSDDKIIVGEAVSIGGAEVSTWARVNGGGKVVWVGLTIPASLADSPPAPGVGPAGAFAVLNYPAIVQQTTYFNHAEIQSNEHGHPANPGYSNTNRYMKAHFDFHFYGIRVAQVYPIPFLPPFPPLPTVPPDRLPAGYAQPEFSVPQMGRHAAPLSEFTATDPWLATMIAGFLPDASYMHFMEPMITHELLQRRQNFSLPVPQPAVLGRATQYPTECVVAYDKVADAFHIVFKGFETIN